MARKLFAEVGALKGKPDWFWKGVEFAQAFSVIELGAVFTFEKDKLDVGSDAISIAHYIQRSVSVCPLRAQLHTSQGLWTKRQRQRGEQCGHAVGCALLKMWEVHTFSGKTGKWNYWASRMGEEGCVMRGFEVQSWEVSGDVAWPEESRDTHHQEVGWGASSGVGASPVLWEESKTSFNEPRFMHLT